MTFESDASGERGEKEPRHLLIGGTLFNYVSSPSPACFHCFLPRFWRTLHRCNQKQTGKEENGSSVNSTDVNSMRRIYPHHQVLKQLERAWTESELSRLLKPQYPSASPNRHRDRCLFPNRRLSNRDSFKEGYERDYDCQLTYIYIYIYMWLCIQEDVEKMLEEVVSKLRIMVFPSITWFVLFSRLLNAS